ncbi:8074_t:CDS:2 [Rhizophagus irregularis]|nr:8074_t:CDS:2 [Rhizophagus irregularis]
MRCAEIRTNQTKWLDNVLDKRKPPIIIDKARIVNENDPTIITHPKLIVSQFHENQFKAHTQLADYVRKMDAYLCQFKSGSAAGPSGMTISE